MSDIFNAKVLCDECNTRMEKTNVLRGGFNVRALECPQCGKNYLHPEDEYKLEQFSKLKNKHFQVKLRMVGNSYTVSIPREIIDYQDEIQKIVLKDSKIIRHLGEQTIKKVIYIPDKIVSIVV